MSTALTVVDQVEQHPAVVALDARTAALLDLLPSPAAVSRFKRGFVQALIKNPELRDCTPESLVLACFEAASMGWEPTGPYGGAHLVPFRTNVGSKDHPRYEKRAQLIPDYRGIVRKVTDEPDVTLIEAFVVKEGDEFDYEMGTDPRVRHKPALDAQRSRRATTHVYAIARLANGGSRAEVVDRSDLERLKARAQRRGRSPAWEEDFDEQAKSKVVKRLCKLLPLRPELGELVARDDDALPTDEAPPALPAGPTKAARLGQRLRADRQAPAAIESESTRPSVADPSRAAVADDEPPPLGDEAAPRAFQAAPSHAEPDEPAEQAEFREDLSHPAPRKGDPCPLHPDVRLAGGDRGRDDLYHSLGRGEGYCRPYHHAG